MKHPLLTELVDYVAHPVDWVTAHLTTCRRCQGDYQRILWSFEDEETCQACGHLLSEHHENEPDGCPWPPAGCEVLLNGQAVPLSIDWEGRG